MKRYKYSSTLICLLMVTLSAGAESLSKAAFEYKAGKLGYLERNEVYSAWNAKNPKEVHKPGMKVMFFGRAEGCDRRVKDGPVKNAGNANLERAMELTGIPLAAESTGQRWSPSGNIEQCDKSVRDQVGDSFVHVNEDPVKGGIGIYTHTGPEQSGKESFFRPIGHEGKDGTGANAGIEGTFVTFQFDWQNGNTVRPWAGDGRSDNQRRATFRTVQSVTLANVGEGVAVRDNEPIQAKQQLVVALINKACSQRKGQGSAQCRLKYLFNVAVFRTGVRDWNDVKWFKNAGVFNDSAQGGIPIVHGPIGISGQVTRAAGMELYESRGEPSQHSAFGDKEFQVQITFAQFKNALRLAAAKSLKKPAAKITSSDVASIYSDSWDDPGEWLVISTNVSQEIHNSNRNVGGQLGGAVREIGVNSLMVN